MNYLTLFNIHIVSNVYNAHWASTGGQKAYFKKKKYFFSLNFPCFILFFNITYQIKLDSKEALSCWTHTTRIELSPEHISYQMCLDVDAENVILIYLWISNYFQIHINIEFHTLIWTWILFSRTNWLNQIPNNSDPIIWIIWIIHTIFQGPKWGQIKLKMA